MKRRPVTRTELAIPEDEIRAVLTAIESGAIRLTPLDDSACRALQVPVGLGA
jgi:hypothetical protein